MWVDAPPLKGVKMNIKKALKGVDWRGMLKAMGKAAWPFLIGLVGGSLAGCTIGGFGPNFFFK